MRTQSASVLETAEFRSDEALLDVYADALEASFRLRADRFDYSGLVTALSYRAELNFHAALLMALGFCLPDSPRAGAAALYPKLYLA